MTSLTRSKAKRRWYEESVGRLASGLALLSVGVWISAPTTVAAQPSAVEAHAEEPCFGPPPPPQPVAVRTGVNVMVWGTPGRARYRGMPGAPRTAPRGSSSSTPSDKTADGTRGSEDGLLDLGSGGDIVVLLVVVAALAVLPVVVHLVDEEAPPVAKKRHRCPSAEVRLVGGYTNAPTSLQDDGVGYGGLHASMAWGTLGVAGELELGPLDVYQQQAGFLLVRAPPKAHIDLSVALGGRRVLFGPLESVAFEAALPQTYYIQPERRTLGLQLRPAIQYGNLGLDARVDGSVLIPLGDFMHLDAGGRVFSLAQNIQFAVFGHLSFNFWASLHGE